MSKTLREKLCDCHNVGVPVGEEAIAKFVDALSARLDSAINEGLARLNGFETRLDAQDDHDQRMKQDFDKGVGELQASIRDHDAALRNYGRGMQHCENKLAEHMTYIRASNKTLDEHEDRLDELAKYFDKLERDLTTLAGADVPSGPEEFIRPDEPDLEGEAMTPDYEAMKDDEDDKPPCTYAAGRAAGYTNYQTGETHDPEPDRPWREAAEVCWCKLVASIDRADGGGVAERIIESAIEKAVMTSTSEHEKHTGRVLEEVYVVRKERDSLKRRVQELQQQHYKLMLDSARHATDMVEENEKLKAKNKTLDNRYRQCRKLADELECERHLLREERDSLKAEVERLGDLDQSRVDELHRALYPNGGELNWNDHIEEVRRLKAAKPKVVGLTRREIEDCMSANLSMEYCTNAILDAQAKKAAEYDLVQDKPSEIEMEVGDD